MGSANKVALNTLILYGRMMITMVISLYSTRLILTSLGSIDFGIYNLVAGVVVILSFLNTAMATATQRYLSFNYGKKDLDYQNKIFSNSLILHFIIGFFLFFLLESSCFLLFENFLNIPSVRLEAAKKVYHFMSLNVFFTVLAVPFTGLLISNENMIWVAFVSILESLLKLGFAFLLFSIESDKLVSYSFFITVTNIITLLLYSTYCFKQYQEASLKYVFPIDLSMIKELSSFAGWNLFGSLCSLGRSQGLAVIFNFFLGTAINAAYGIALQVSNQLNFLSATLLRAINPQIMKSEGAGQRRRMLRLSLMASKFGFFLLSGIAIPIIFEMEDVLSFWLNNVPEYTVIFCQIILIGTLINQLTIGLQSAIQAIGKIKIYQLVVGTVILLNLPISFVLLKNDFPAYSVLISFSIIEIIACSLRLLFIYKTGNLSFREYFNKVLLMQILPVLILMSSCYLIVNFVILPYRFFVTILSSLLLYGGSIYMTGLCKDEKAILIRMFYKLKEKYTIFQKKRSLLKSL